MRSNILNKLAALALVTAGCAVQGSAGEKSGAALEPVTLRLGTPEDERAPYADEVKEFARSVEELSDGTIVIDTAWGAVVPWTPQSEHQLATMVSEGEIDLALVPTRVWDQLDVTSMQALQAPFLVDDLGLLNEIAAGDLAGEMLAGLEPLGVEGLAMWPESLRHPVSFGAPLMTAADFEGARVRVQTSDASYRLARALGAEPVNPPHWEEAVHAGELDAMESAFIWSFGYPVLGTFTGNITFYPKVNSLVAHAATFDELTSDQQQVLRDAAADSVEYTIETNLSEHDLALEYCSHGGSVALAEDSDLAELVAVAAPVIEEIKVDAVTARLIDEITALKEAGAGIDPADEAIACEPPRQDGSVTSAGGEAAFPEGVYRVVFPDGLVDSTGELLGLPVEIIFTFTFRDGTWHATDSAQTGDCGGTYVIDSGRIWTNVSTELPCGYPPGAPFWDAAWTFQDGELRFFDLNGNRVENAIMTTNPWTKIE